jgi:glycosyltransferase involved in cell wall biosynthesis
MPPDPVRPRTVLHLIETSGMGGAERVLVDLVRNLDRRRWRSVVVVPWAGWLLDRLTEHGIEAVELREHGSFDVACLSRITTLARRVNADIIHSHLFGSAVRAGIVARLRGVPAVGTIHGLVDFQASERYRSLKLGIVRHGLQSLVFVSEPLRQACLESMRLDENLTCVIHNGVDTKRFAPTTDSSLRSAFGISPDDFVVGCVGRLQPVKSIETFLEAAAILKASAPGYRFLVVGDGDAAYTRELHERRDRLGLANDVVFAGYRATVNEFLATFDVYALTSRSEGFSLSTIEAMAAGLPVVATRCGGPEQILEDGITGLLVENGSATAVAAAIRRLRSDPNERTLIGRAARDVVLRRYTVEAQVNAYEQLYEHLLLHQRRRTPRKVPRPSAPVRP